MRWTVGLINESSDYDGLYGSQLSGDQNARVLSEHRDVQCEHLPSERECNVCDRGRTIATISFNLVINIYEYTVSTSSA